MNRTIVGVLCLVVAAAAWGCWSIVFRTAEKLSLTPLSSTKETALISIAATAVLAPLALRHARRQQHDDNTRLRRRRGLRMLLVLGICEALNSLCFFAAMQHTTVAIAVLCHYLTPVIVAVASPLLLRERFRASTAAALAVALVGLALLLQPWRSVSEHDAIGAGLAALSAVFYAATVLIAKGQSQVFAPLELAAVPKISAVPALIAAVVITGDVHIELAPAMVLIVGGVVCGAIPTLLFYAGLSRVLASQASVLTLVEPLTAVIIGVVVWGEPLGAVAAVGGACVLVGAGIIARQQ